MKKMMCKTRYVTLLIMVQLQGAWRMDYQQECVGGIGTPCQARRSCALVATDLSAVNARGPQVPFSYATT
jgi:hypothetical protein